MYVFNEPTSSARSVNSSGLSLTVTSGRPSGTFGLRTLNFPMPWLKYPTSRARWLSVFMNSQPLREALPAPHTEVCHNVLYEAVSIFLLVRQQLQRINQISAQGLRYCMRFEDLGLVNTFTCLYDQEPVWLLPIVLFLLHRSCTTNYNALYLPRPTRCGLPKGSCCNAGTSRTL